MLLMECHRYSLMGLNTMSRQLRKHYHVLTVCQPFFQKKFLTSSGYSFFSKAKCLMVPYLVTASYAVVWTL